MSVLMERDFVCVDAVRLSLGVVTAEIHLPYAHFIHDGAQSVAWEQGLLRVNFWEQSHRSKCVCRFQPHSSHDQFHRRLQQHSIVVFDTSIVIMVCPHPYAQSDAV